MAGYRKLPSGKWQATVRLPDGRRRTRTDPLKGVVVRWAQDAESAIRREEWADPQDGRITLAQWWRQWSDTRVIERATSDRDVSHWRNHVAPRWGEVRLAAITPLDVERWLAKMQREAVGATTRAQSFRLLRQMLSDAARHRLIATDPTTGIKAPKVPRHVDRFLSFAEFDALIEAMPTDRDRALAMLMAMCGLRWGEAAGLHSHRVDLVRGQLLVQEVTRRDGSVKAVPKSAAGQRTVPVPERVGEVLRPFLGQDALLFPGVDYTNWRRRVWVPAVRAAGLAAPLPTPHDLRHSYGSWLAEAGVSPTDIMGLLGHSSLRATERYLHATPGRFERVRAALGR